MAPDPPSACPPSAATLRHRSYTPRAGRRPRGGSRGAPPPPISAAVARATRLRHMHCQFHPGHRRGPRPWPPRPKLGMCPTGSMRTHTCAITHLHIHPRAQVGNFRRPRPDQQQHRRPKLIKAKAGSANANGAGAVQEVLDGPAVAPEAPQAPPEAPEGSGFGNSGRSAQPPRRARPGSASGHAYGHVSKMQCRAQMYSCLEITLQDAMNRLHMLCSFHNNMFENS